MYVRNYSEAKLFLNEDNKINVFYNVIFIYLEHEFNELHYIKCLLHTYSYTFAIYYEWTFFATFH